MTRGTPITFGSIYLVYQERKKGDRPEAVLNLDMEGSVTSARKSRRFDGLYCPGFCPCFGMIH